jgi:predicted O-methyltransferase YrrM
VYWPKALGSIVSNLCADTLHPHERKFEFTKSWLSYGLSHDQRLRAKTLGFTELYPAAESMVVPMEVRYRLSNVTPTELYCLSCVAMLHKAKRIFEIGTYDGATTRQLARACSSSQVFTLDLSRDDQPKAARTFVPTEVNNLMEGGVGSRFVDTPEQQRIVQLYGDSTQFDYSAYKGTIDLVFIDACHDYDFVRADSQTALGLIKPGGIIFWHDYCAGWPGVKRAVEELLPQYPILHIDSTSLAILDTTTVGRSNAPDANKC